MLGAVVAGLACWDRFEAGARRYWLVAGWTLPALGFAIKISAAFLIVPLVLCVLRKRRKTGILLACATLLPALSWYAWADHVVAGGGGSRASADNRAHLAGPARFLRPVEPRNLGVGVPVSPDPGVHPDGRDHGVSGFVSICRRGLRPPDRSPDVAGSNKDSDGVIDRFWWIWGLAASAALAILARKLHHEYYFLVLAPVAAAGIGHAMDRLAAVNRHGLRDLRGADHGLSGSGPVDLADAGRVGRAGCRVAGRCDGDARRCLGRCAGGVAVPGRSPRLPHGVEPFLREAGGRRVGSGARGPGRSNWSNTIAATVPGISPTWATDGPTSAKGLARRGPATIQGHCGLAPTSSSPIWPIPRRTGMPTDVRPVTIPDFVGSGSRNGVGSPC